MKNRFLLSEAPGRMGVLLSSFLLVAGIFLVKATHAGENEAAPLNEGPNKQPHVNMQESRVGPYSLPDPLATPGGPIRSPAAWQAHRKNMISLFENHVYGRAPGQPDALEFERSSQEVALDGKAIRKRIGIVSSQDGRQHRFTLDLYVPRAAKKPVAVFLLLNHRNTSTLLAPVQRGSGPGAAEYLIGQGFAAAEIQASEIAPDHPVRFREGVIGLFEEHDASRMSGHSWGAVAAWAWGARRALDYLETDPAIDRSRIALVGHSRGGKAVLWAGALDERFAMVIANNSGEGGAALARREYGETIAIMTNSFPHWFTRQYRDYADRESSLPVDQHMLLSLIAPRPLYISSATEDRWADPRGEFLSLAHASPVYGLWKEPAIHSHDMPPPDTPLMVGRRGYHIRSGGHDLKVADWENFVRFARKVQFGSDAKAAVMTSRQTQR